MLMKLVIFGALMCYLPVYLETVCDNKPKGATGSPYPGGTKFRIVVATNPEKYNPRQIYRVILQGKSSVMEEPNLFNGFTLSATPTEKPQDPTITYGPLSAGIFEILPNEVNTKIDENCPNTVVHTSHIFIPKIEVLWIAPEPGIGCVRFRAAVMEQNLWFQNSGGLTLELCENKDLEITNGHDKCCPCNEAKYEMKFEGLWTRQSHPKFFPSNMWLTRFSDVIGASHATDYRFWRVNETASTGLSEFSESGNTTILESEIKSSKTRTVIKAKGISYPNITGKTFAVFRVDPEHHLLSLISLIKPSPDWFVGIPGLELCDSKCNWISEKSLDLYPYDLGLREGTKYESKTERQDPRGQIQKIDSWNDPESPFYTDHTEKLKPMARVYLIKAREYESNKNNCRTGDNIEDRKKIESGGEYTEISTIFSAENEDDSKNEVFKQKCRETAYGEFSECSLPTCDADRVKVQFRRFEESVREFCLKHNYSEERTNKCSPDCKDGKLMIYSQCNKSTWSPFSKCEPSSCIRIRRRTALDEFTKTNLQCANVIWKQQINCSPEECVRSRSNR